VLIARHHDRLTRNPDDFVWLMQVCGKAKIKISPYTGGELDLSTASGGFYGFMETGRSWYESAIRSQRVKDAVERNTRAGKRTGGGSRPFGYKINRHDLGEGGRRRYRIIGEEIEPAEAEAIKEAATSAARREYSQHRLRLQRSRHQAGRGAAGGWGRRCAGCWSQRGSRVCASTTARWSARRRG
jgi:Resolvase, N terminal domain